MCSVRTISREGLCASLREMFVVFSKGDIQMKKRCAGFGTLSVFGVLLAASLPLLISFIDRPLSEQEWQEYLFYYLPGVLIVPAIVVLGTIVARKFKRRSG